MKVEKMVAEERRKSGKSVSEGNRENMTNIERSLNKNKDTVYTNL